MAGATERVFVAPPIPTGGGKVIAAPFQFYTTGEDNLRIVSANSVVGVSLVIQGRLVDSTGLLTAASWTHTPNSDRSLKTTEIPLAAGAVLNLTVFANAGAPKIGQTFVMVQLIRGLGAAAVVLGTLLQGYVTSAQALAWPGSPIVGSTEGEPPLRIIRGTQPPAGGNVAETCPTGARWQVVMILLVLTTNATAGNRNMELLLFDPNFGVFANFEPGVNIQPSTTQNIMYGLGIQTFGVVTPAAVEYVTLPVSLYLLAGQTFETFTLGLAAGDQYAAPLYQVREWLEVN